MTQTELDTQVTNYQCCMANLGSNLVDLLLVGDKTANCYALKFIGGMTMVLGLKDYILDDGCITQTEICDTLDKIENLCSSCCS